jgi:hypothetical protein
MTEAIQVSARVAPGLRLSTRGQDWLRVVAVGLMLVDHASKTMIHDPAHLGHLLGRAAFPLFALLVAYNLERHRTPLVRYLLPMLAFGLLAQVPYWALFGGPNIMWTLALGVVACAPGRIAWASLEHLAVVVAVLVVALVTGANYGAFGVLLFLGARLVVREASPWHWALFGVCALFANASLFGVTALASIGIVVALRAVPGARLRLGRWWAYWVYPAHLWALLGLAALGWGR